MIAPAQGAWETLIVDRIEKQPPRWLSGAAFWRIVGGAGVAMAASAFLLCLAFGNVLFLIIDHVGTPILLVLLPLAILTGAVRWFVEHRRKKAGRPLPEPGPIALIYVIVVLVGLVAFALLAVPLLVTFLAGASLATPLFRAFILVIVGPVLLVTIPLNLALNCLLLAKMLTRQPAHP